MKNLQQFTKSLLLLLCMLQFACNGKQENGTADKYKLSTPNWPPPAQKQFVLDASLTKEIYYDKILGSLVGSAIGDAMGAPTEMWHRNDINTQQGYVTGLDALIREQSPEGPWGTNTPGGGTTDDTRWKYLLGAFLVNQQGHPDSLNAKDFAKHLLDRYQQNLTDIKKLDTFDPEPIEKAVMRLAWLQEWAKVAQPYYENQLDEYSYARDRFYGGEMVCGGMLYAPLLGAYYPAAPESAYREAYRLGIFDLGYARDITGLTAALVSEAMRPNVAFEKIGLVSLNIDPQGYFKSRLVGRAAYRVYTQAKEIVRVAQGLTEKDISKELTLPKNYKYDKLYLTQVTQAYKMLDEHLQDMPFHAAEIHLINLTALEFGKGDFRKTIEFVVNYGRDNDTVAAVTGAILGAYVGYKQLPPDLAKQSLATNAEILGIDLEVLARDLTETLFKNK